MQQVDYNPPNTRARVKALRVSHKLNGKKGSRLALRALRAFRHNYHLNDAVPNPFLKRRLGRFRRRALRTRLTTPSARRRKRATAQVEPGMVRRVWYWLQTGQLASFLLFWVAIGGLLYVFTSSHFNVHQITVEGNELVADKVIAELAHVYEDPIWLIDSHTAAQQILANNYVEHVSIRVAVPDQVYITVREREPEVYWKVGSAYYLVDKEGVVLDIASEPPGDFTVVVQDSTNPFLSPGDRIDPDAVDLAHVLTVRLASETNIPPFIVGWDFGLGVYVKTQGDQLIVFGKSENLDRKIAVLNYLLQDETAFTYMDLRPSNPFYQNKQDVSQSE